ncbi:MAG: hypothetical protein K9M57_07110 [Phycisphaerae bacterium]|nr:hypothetical protein [Phycisphaerae bacterium]
MPKKKVIYGTISLLLLLAFLVIIYINKQSVNWDNVERIIVKTYYYYEIDPNIPPKYGYKYYMLQNQDSKEIQALIDNFSEPPPKPGKLPAVQSHHGEVYIYGITDKNVLCLYFDIALQPEENMGRKFNRKKGIFDKQMANYDSFILPIKEKGEEISKEQVEKYNIPDYEDIRKKHPRFWKKEIVKPD